MPPRRPAPDAVLAAAALSRLLAREEAAKAAASRSSDPFSPWARVDGWRLGGRGRQELVFRDGAEQRLVGARYQAGSWLLQFDDHTILAQGERRADAAMSIVLNGVRKQITVLDNRAETAVFFDGESWRLVEVDPLAAGAGEDPTAGRLTAPMPGRVTQLMVEPGVRVRRGQPLIVIEAMKMEHTVTAPADGVVEAVRFAPGDLVEEGAELIALAPGDVRNRADWLDARCAAAPFEACGRDRRCRPATPEPRGPSRGARRQLGLYEKPSPPRGGSAGGRLDLLDHPRTHPGAPAGFRLL